MPFAKPSESDSVYIIGLHFGRPYDPACISSAIRCFSGYLRPEITIYLTDLPRTKVTKRNVDRTKLDFSRGNTLKIDDSRLTGLLSTAFPSVLEVCFGHSGRIARIAPWIHADETFTLRIDVPIPDALPETLESAWRLIHPLQGEMALAKFCGAMDPVWTSLGLEGYTPSIMEVAVGVESPPSWVGFYGSWLVDLIGRAMLLESMKNCKELYKSPRGGIYFRWMNHPSAVREAREVEVLVKKSLAPLVAKPPVLPAWAPPDCPELRAVGRDTGTS